MGCDTLNLPSASKLINPEKTYEDISSQHFKKIRVIGTGSYGKVYLIRSKETGKYYALKTIKIIENEGNNNIFQNYNNLERILREAYILRRLDHSNIISFKGAFQSNKSNENNTLNIITEYCEKGDLGKELLKYSKEGKYFKEEEILNWLIQCSLALIYLYDLEILHRDIKPSNIFLMENNTIKLGDFGISKDISIFHITRTEIGTELYMAPEILKKEKYDLKIDVWSLGVTFCH